MKRRHFLKTTAAAAPLLISFSSSLTSISCEKRANLIDKRTLGRTGEKLSMIGFGGIVVMDATPAQASNRVGEAIDYGINYFDVAPAYGDAEIKLGPALEPYRSDVFLACKTDKREQEDARNELERSLKRLKTDHFDLYQFHAVTDMEEVETILGPGGALETFVKAREQGLIRYIGFSAHSVEAAMALMDGFDFDTILFPINFATWHAGNFGPQVLAKAEEKGMGILALKAMAKGRWPEGANEDEFPKCWYQPMSNPDDALMGLKFTLSHGVTAALPPGDENLFRMALDLAKKFEPLNPSDVEEMKQKGLALSPLFRYPRT
jgi:aryl-alcohol dehydrogenase-like predicted oxidoreductase